MTKKGKSIATVIPQEQEGTIGQMDGTLESKMLRIWELVMEEMWWETRLKESRVDGLPMNQGMN